MARAENRSFDATRPLMASFVDFMHAAIRPRTPLARAIVAVLYIKLIAVGGMMIFQHSVDRTETAGSAGVARRLGPSSTP